MASLLNSWKEIATYLGRGVRTVQRWEHDLGLPIRRPHGKSKSCVYAFPPELDRWLQRAHLNNGNAQRRAASIRETSLAKQRQNETRSIIRQLQQQVQQTRALLQKARALAAQRPGSSQRLPLEGCD